MYLLLSELIVKLNFKNVFDSREKLYLMGCRGLL